MSLNPRTLDLFCGAGGSSYGARLAGAQIVAGVDKWGIAVKSYRANFPEAKVLKRDIDTLSSSYLKQKIGDIDLILASPECTNHSKAKGAGEICEESRKTAFHTLKFIKRFNPTWVIIENVVEMMDWSEYGRFIERLEKLDYYVNEPVILNAKNFGVPQSRLRLFILCSHLGKPECPQLPQVQEVPVASILEENHYQFSPLRKVNRAPATIIKADHAIQHLGEDKPFLIVYYGSAKNGVGGWQTLDEPLRTITTLDRFAYVRPGENSHEMRMLQPEELKFAMGFGEDYKLDEIKDITQARRRDRIKLMGNGVCPPVMKVIVESLIAQQKNSANN